MEFDAMEFQSAPPSIVRSVKQRDLLNAWLRLYDKNPRPALAHYAPDRLGEEQRDLVYYKVFATANGLRFMINSEGSRLAQGYGRVNEGNKGTWLDEYLDPEVAPIVLPVYLECAKRRLPVYTISKIVDVRGQTIDYERLVLPFFERGRVSDIIMSAKLISEASRFELNNLFRVREKLPLPTVRVVVDQELTPAAIQRQSKTESADAHDDVVEI
jgi:hypothetical protein